MLYSNPQSLINSEKSLSELINGVQDKSTYSINNAFDTTIQRTIIKDGFELNYKDIECSVVLNEPSEITYEQKAKGIEWTNTLDIPTKVVSLSTVPDLNKELFYTITCNKGFDVSDNKLVITEDKYNFEIDLNTLTQEYSEPVYDTKEEPEILSYDVIF